MYLDELFLYSRLKCYHIGFDKETFPVFEVQVQVFVFSTDILSMGV